MARKAPVFKEMGAARDPVRVEVEGARELERRMAFLTGELTASALHDALDRGAEITEDVARQLAPVGHPEERQRETTLKDHIGRETVERSADRVEIHVANEAEAFWGMILEVGAPANNLPPEPWMRPAFDNTHKDVETFVTRRVRRNLRTLTRFR